jgi:putative DNA primase/helicase
MPIDPLTAAPQVETISEDGPTTEGRPLCVTDPVRPVPTLDLDDRGDTLRILDALYDEHHDHLGLVYVLGLGFLRYEAGAWDEVTDAQVAALISDIFDGLKLDALAEVASLTYTLAHPDTDRATASEARERLEAAERRAKHFSSRQRQTTLETLVRSLKGQEALQRNVTQLDREHHLLVAANGTVDLRTGVMVESSPHHLITRRVATAYKPHAEAPRWEQFLTECHPDRPEVVSFLQRMAGYSITGETAEHVFFLHAGRGSNGKGTFMNTLTSVLEGTVQVRSADMLDPRRGAGQEMAELRGARLVVVNEGEVGQSISEARLKTLTGGDFISARKLYQPTVQFRPSFALHFSTNHKPRFRDATDGLWRRLRLVEWNVHFTADQRDPYLERDLRREAEGILAWAVQGAVAWYQDGGLRAPASITDAVETYREVVDQLSGFLDGEVFVKGDDADRVPFKEVHEAYLEWWSEGKPWSAQALRQALEERGCQFVKPKGKWHLKGYRKVTAAEARSGFTVVAGAAPTTNSTEAPEAVTSTGTDGTAEVFTLENLPAVPGEATLSSVFDPSSE